MLQKTLKSLKIESNGLFRSYLMFFPITEQKEAYKKL